MLTPALRLALYQPDMPPNTGAMMRLCACLGVGLDIIEPCGFVFDDRKPISTHEKITAPN